MKKIAIIIPYFGTLPNYFEAWKISALHNPDIDFLMYTDNTELCSINNIKVSHCTLDDIKEKIQSLYDFEITTLDKPYKLCDFKPAYGDIFSEDLEQYDFWGYCDIDLIFGNIRKYLNEEVLQKYDRCLLMGHLALYRNTENMNKLYQLQGNYPEMNYQNVFQSEDSFYFDEYGGMETKTYRGGVKFYNAAPILNLLPHYSMFELKDAPVHIEWNNGYLFSVDRAGIRTELLYAHYSKRKFEVISVSDKPVITVTPSQIFIGQEVNPSSIKITKRESHLWYLFQRSKNSNKTIIRGLKRYIWACKLRRYIVKIKQEYCF